MTLNIADMLTESKYNDLVKRTFSFGDYNRGVNIEYKKEQIMWTGIGTPWQIGKEFDEYVDTLVNAFKIFGESTKTDLPGTLGKMVWEKDGCKITLHIKSDCHVLYIRTPICVEVIESFQVKCLDTPEQIAKFIQKSIKKSKENPIILSSPPLKISPLLWKNSAGVHFCGDNIDADWAMCYRQNPY